ncbi:glycosyltransferase family 2 protein [Aliivibrio sp. S3MY1]|uniref:glycosyltransferase family 2 protein n=1 Tax=unclassified Aliivibrio TaxID=2645654 RepID=UPI0023781B00|nr:MULTISPECIES: glycosyltransferase family 2 protein [unclassified Aliivibrio]MDD9196712.1 glycosyltransferase family 2 protein [Aliivibrio sp. S3MY1]MDD9199797.1 glycosyltransferase family 2 protein [Aliivibrio sp. S2MY1]
MASYNGVLFIEMQISSIIKQLSESDELIISDDGSNDGTIDVIKKFIEKDKRIKLLSGPQSGLIANFGNALKQAKGDYIFLADQDDIWEDNKVLIFIDKLKYHTLVISDCTVNDIDLKLLNKSFYELNGSKSGFFKNLYKNSFLGCCMAFRRELLTDILPFPNKIPMHDWWIGLVAETKYSTTFISDKLLKYRRHGMNASQTSEKSKSSIITKINYRFSLLYYILLKRLL